MEIKNAKTQQNGSLMPPHGLTNFEIQKHYQNKLRFNIVYSRENLPKIKDGTYVINLDEYSDIGTHWVVLYVSGASSKDVGRAIPKDVEICSFGVDHIRKEIEPFIVNKNKKTNIFRVQVYDSIMSGYFLLDLLIL